MNMNAITRQLKEYALSKGIDLIGITSANPFIKQDGNGTSIDPKKLLNDARALIVTGFYMNEIVAAPCLDKDNPKGRFTHGYSVRAFTPMENYYTEVIKSFLEKQGFKVVSNTNYLIPDKMAAARAGIGKYGKNSVIITKEYGSYIMFVVLVTNAPLDYEEYAINTSDCGECTLCIKSCPTGAICKPYKVNRKMCITDWLWGAFIPAELREKQENRIFGCGECIKACPGNKKLTPRNTYPVEIDGVSTTPELIPLVTADGEYYKKAIASFPMRAGVDVIRGNAIIALGNTGSEKAIDPLTHTLAHPYPQIRAYSAWALGRIAGVKAEEALGKALKCEAVREVSKEIRDALGRE